VDVVVGVVSVCDRILNAAVLEAAVRSKVSIDWSDRRSARDNPLCVKLSFRASFSQLLCEESTEFRVRSLFKRFLEALKRLLTLRDAKAIFI
jgi:hypothetical protein